MKARLLITCVASCFFLGCRAPQEQSPKLRSVVDERDGTRGRGGIRVQTFWRGENRIARIVSEKRNGTWRAQWQTFFTAGAPTITVFYRDPDGEIERVGLGAGDNYEVFEMVDGQLVPVSETERQSTIGAREHGAEAASEMWDLIRAP